MRTLPAGLADRRAANRVGVPEPMETTAREARHQFPDEVQAIGAQKDVLAPVRTARLVSFGAQRANAVAILRRMTEIDPRGPSFAPPEQTPVKVCPSCSVQTKTDGAFCPHCGASYARAGANTRRRVPRKTLLLALAVMLILGAGAGGVLKIRHDSDVKAQRAAVAAEAQKKAEAARAADDAAREARRQQAEADNAKRAERAEMVTQLEAAILKDAKGRDYLDPVRRVICTPLGGGSGDDLTALTGSFTCNAVTDENADGTYSGYGFAGVVNWTTGALTWHYGN